MLGGAAPFAWQMAAAGSAASQSAPDYRALVCVFLFGGNDANNMLMATDSDSWGRYFRARNTGQDPIALMPVGTAPVAVGQTSAVTGRVSALNRPEAWGGVLPITPARAQPIPAGTNATSRTFGLHPHMAPVQNLFNQGRLALVANVGTLVAPITKAQYNARTVPVPANLFSHNDQQSTWQAGNPEGATSGWGGRMGDVFAADNAASTFACISTGGTSVFVSGRATAQYQLNSTGPVGITGLSGSLFGSAAASQALRTLATAATGPSLLEQEHGKLVGRSISATNTVTAALAAAPALAAAFPTTGLGNQLKMVARMLSARGSLGVRRQVFFVTLGGFDTHDDMLVNHPALMTQLADALAAFDAAMTGLGIQDRVTTFTASDFGRTLSSNGDGSDHGWGSHHVVMGGAVRGRRIHGTSPVPANGGPDDVGQGRYLPTTSVDQLGATLATWFGVSASNLPLVMPGIVRYTVKDIGLFS